jgi:sugar (pentulose or hexulose) kinase
VERWSLDVVREMGAPTGGELFASGGAIRSEVWLQLRADVLGRPLHVSSRAESAVGAAILAASGAAFGSISEAVSQMVRIDRSFEPRREHARYFEDKCRRLQAACKERQYL